MLYLWTPVNVCNHVDIYFCPTRLDFRSPCIGLIKLFKLKTSSTLQLFPFSSILIYSVLQASMKEKFGCSPRDLTRVQGVFLSRSQ